MFTSFSKSIIMCDPLLSNFIRKKKKKLSTLTSTKQKIRKIFSYVSKGKFAHAYTPRQIHNMLFQIVQVVNASCRNANTIALN